MKLSKIISGGQTGVDRAALDVAIDLAIPCGGWCPAGRKSEDGEIPRHYPLLETDSSRYEVRTKRNVRDSDGTLIVTMGDLSGGTALTVRTANREVKPLFVIDLASGDQCRDLESLHSWLVENAISILNIAGPRESTSPGISVKAKLLLSIAFTGTKQSSPTNQQELAGE